MFTGLVETGIIHQLIKTDGGFLFLVTPPFSIERVQKGDSVAVDGACLTVDAIEENAFRFFVSPETLQRTIVSDYRVGQRVNIELPLKSGDFVGGHYVLGHVDAVTTIKWLDRKSTAWRMQVEIPEPFRKYIVYKGSIAINGVSLTINEDLGDAIELCIIPITIQKTGFADMNDEARVNLEVDVLSKFTEKLLRSNATRI